MAPVAALAKVAPPATDVVAYLGAPAGDDARPVGDGGLAVTRFRAGHPATVVFAQAALTGLSGAAVQSMAAHDRSVTFTPTELQAGRVVLLEGRATSRSVPDADGRAG